MNTGFNIYGMEYDPGRSIKTYFNGRLVGSWTHDISTTPYEIVIWNSQASDGASGYHTTGASPNPSDLSVAEVQAYALSPVIRGTLPEAAANPSIEAGARCRSQDSPGRATDGWASRRDEDHVRTGVIQVRGNG